MVTAEARPATTLPHQSADESKDEFLWQEDVWTRNGRLLGCCVLCGSSKPQFLRDKLLKIMRTTRTRDGVNKVVAL